jgi:tetratricopeptide (TPR) repeat protein
MDRRLREIKALLQAHEIKKAEYAVAQLVKSRQTDFERAQVLLERARIYFISQRPELSIQDLTKIGRYSPTLFEKPGTQELLADGYFARFELSAIGFSNRDDLDEAQRIYQNIANHAVSYVNIGWVYYQLGRLHILKDQSDAAIQCLCSALVSPSKIENLHSYCYERLSYIALYEYRRSSAALQFINTAIQVVTRNDDDWWFQLQELKGRIQNAQGILDPEVIESITSLAANSSDRTFTFGLYYTAGELLTHHEGYITQAIEYLNNAIDIAKPAKGIDVAMSRCSELLGDCRLHLGDYEPAIYAYEQSLRFNAYHPLEASILFRIAKCYYQKRDYQRVIDNVKKIEVYAARDNIHLTDYRIYDILGNAHFVLGQYRRAAQAYEVALKLVANGTPDAEKIRLYYHFAIQLI